MKRREIIKDNEVSELYTFTLADHPQKVLIEGKSRALPIVITLHGGPGTPIPFSAGCRGLFPEFTDKFIMVYWDQLGCGINNHPIDETFTIDTFSDMTADLIREIRKLFPKNSIHLFATSWGSILSARVLEKAPGMVDGVVVCGQIVRDVFLCEEVFHALEQSKLPAAKLAQIRKVEIEHITPKDLQLISTSIRKYTSGYTNRSGRKAPMGKVILGLLTSPDYSFRDFKAVMVNGYAGNTALWKEILRLDLTEILQNVRIPYVMLQGDTDIVASTQTVTQIAESSKNPCLQYRIIENTGHMPGADMMDAVFQMLLAQTAENAAGQ